MNLGFNEIWRMVHSINEFIQRIKDKHDEENVIDVAYKEVKSEDAIASM